MVTKGYLRAWADSRGRVDVLDLKHGRGFSWSVENATVVSYAYDPQVLSRDLERDYSEIEGAGVPALLKLRTAIQIDSDEQSAIIKFLDMHLDRGRYADQTDVRIPAVLLKNDGSIEDAELNLGDRLLLSQHVPDVLRLGPLGLENGPWRLRDARGLATGDGAVLLWQPTEGAGVATISSHFPQPNYW